MIVNLTKIEKKWQKIWEKEKIFEANVDKQKPKFFVTFPYPYVNGAPHIGAAFTAFRVDSYARFKRMQGFNVLYPQGFHATGEPILGAIERLKQNDKTQEETFKLYRATKKDIENFIKKGAEFTARFWMKRWIEDLKLAGFSIDWRRTFITAITPTYSRFIEWQYNTLRKKGYVVQGTHPLIWCPKCQSPTGDHDRLEGEGESPIDFILIKFKLDSGEILPCGTLRPETIFGVTNIWVNPSIEYVKARVDSEVWIISKEASEKLKDQLKKVEVLGKIKGEELIGKYVENPKTKEKVIILPAEFVDPDAASGIVMSVPSHAPYDWIALYELQKNPEKIRKYGVEEEVKKIKPISIIKTPGFGEHPAIEVCSSLKIESQKEKEKLDEATTIVYKKEFHQGILKENCQEYSSSKVSECKEKLSKEFVEKGIAEIMWESTGKVICRCGTKNHVKILENQWFLKYSDLEWKKKALECIRKMKFYPEEVRVQFEKTVEWLKDKACTRKAGLGTNLPWDKEWKVETLSDSTIYMAYYTIARIINENNISAEKLTDEVFDYVFLGKGNLEEISKKSKLDRKIIEKMREEFEYFYPVDLRNSGKDLVPNHLTFYIFHHTAIFEEKHWPKAIGVNGYVNVLGVKMSKSKGNIIPLRDLVEKIGSDLVRINLIASNEGLDDADWREESVESYKSKIKFLGEIIKNLKKAKRREIKKVDLFLRSKIQGHIKNSTQAYEEMRFRSAVQHALFDFANDLKWYIERNSKIENCNKEILKESIEIMVKLLTPVLPHLCEEFWHKLGKKSLIATEKWPSYDESKVDKNVLELEEILKKTLEDLKEVIKLSGKKENCYLYLASPQEYEYFKEAEEFLSKNFGFKKTLVFRASDEKRFDPENRASRAKYGKPGIYLT
ncbi:MAG: leucine--tRNA ligase [Candidatus Aenigmatarchaeota archaeon]